MEYQFYVDENSDNTIVRQAVEEIDEALRRKHGGNSAGVQYIWFHRDEYGVCIRSIDYLEQMPSRYKDLQLPIREVRFYDEFPGGEIPVGVYELPHSEVRAIVEERAMRADDGTYLLTRIRITAQTVEAVNMMYRSLRTGSIQPAEPWLGRKKENAAA